jgi:hypothetical protein
VKLARHRKPMATYFLSYVDYRPDTNASNIMKNRLLKGEITYMRGRVKEDTKVNMFGVLPVQECRILKSVGVTIRRGLR